MNRILKVVPFMSAAALMVSVERARACARDGTPGPCHCAERKMMQSLLDSSIAIQPGPGSPISPVSPIPPATPANLTQTVHVFDFEYSTNPVGMPIMDATIHVGDTINWVWDGGFHSVTSVANSAESFNSFDLFEIGDTFEHTYTHTGTFAYYCDVHGFDNNDGTAGGMAGVITVLPAVASGSSWNVNANGNWSATGNWQGAVPSGVDAVANFGTAINSPRTVTVDTPRTLGTMNFDSPIGYTIAGTATLTLDVSSDRATINATAGSHTISAPLVLNDDTTIITGDGASLVFSGNVFSTGKLISKAGAGTAQFENVRAASLNVSGGFARISAKATPNSASGTSVVGSLFIESTATLDMTNNAMVIDYSGSIGTQLVVTRQNLQFGRMISSSGDASRRPGYGDNTVLGKTTFAGQSVDSDSILIKFTFAGDANLDGQVDVTDLGALATNWQNFAPWTGGDFNYDGLVDVTDLGMLATNWQAGVGSPLTSASSVEPGRGSLDQAMAAVGLAATSVPEPAVAIFALAGFLAAPPGRRKADGCGPR